MGNADAAGEASCHLLFAGANILEEALNVGDATVVHEHVALHAIGQDEAPQVQRELGDALAQRLVATDEQPRTPRRLAADGGRR